MKKTVLLLMSLFLTGMMYAQQKVAILETVDKAQNVSYGVKLLLRSSLTSAISNTPGYEGYDRVDMASIAGEQDFQRTGNVSDSQIKQLGVATGAKYVLVAEAAKYDATSIIITAKILDVETFGVSSSAVLVSGTSADEMQKSCATLAQQLLRPVKTAQTTQQPVSQTQPTPKPVQQKPAVQQQYQTTPQYTRPATPSEKRSTWFGISLDMGFLTYSYSNYSSYYDEYGNYYSTSYDNTESMFMVGLVADVQFSINNSFSVGPYLGANFAIEDEDIAIQVGAMTKFTFNNNSAVMVGLGGVIFDEEFALQLRAAYKFKSPFYITASYILGSGSTVGFGYSFGGKL